MKISREGAIPLYQQILNSLREQIASGEWKPDARLPTEAELSAALGVSRVTVRQALQAARDEGLIVSTPGRGTFVAQSGSTGRGSDFIGYVVPHLSSNFNVQMLVGAESVLKANGYQLIFCNSEADLAEENRLLNRLDRDGLIGCIIQPVHSSSENRVIARLARGRFPVVMVDRSLKGIETDTVISDHFRGGYVVTEHLIQQGYTDITYVCDQLLDLSSVTERLHGYQTAMLDHELRPSPPVVFNTAAELGYNENVTAFTASSASTITEIAAWVRRADRPQAIVAMNDLFGLLIYQAAHQAGLKIPDDLAVAGFDDLDFAATLQPAMTTVAQKPMELGSQAAELLIRRIRGDRSPVTQIRLPSQLIVRQSSLKSTVPVFRER